ncbi:MAG: hypothetical protein AAGE94_26120, partial [Acidobacteriota bacterium]
SISRPIAPERVAHSWLRCVPFFVLLLVGWPATSLAQDTEPTSPTPQTAGSEATDGSPDRIARQLALSVEPQPVIEVAAADGFFTASVPAKLAGPVRSHEPVYQLDLQFGPSPEMLLTCFVYRQGVDLGSLLLLYTEQHTQAVAAHHGGVSGRTLHAVDAGHFEASPWIGLNWFVHMPDRGSGASTVQAKFWVAMVDERTVYCGSTMVFGYDDSVFAVFRSLVETITFADDPLRDVQVYYEALSLVRIGENPVGFARELHYFDASGNLFNDRHSTLVLPVDPAHVTSIDSLFTDRADLDGRLIARTYLRSENGDGQTHLQLGRGADGTWTVRGSLQGKPLETPVGPADLFSELGVRVALRGYLEIAEPETYMSYSDWNPELDPTTFVTVHLAFDGRDGDRWRLIDGQPTTLTMTFDRTLSERSLAIDLGQAMMTYAPVWSTGNVLYPSTRRANLEATTASASPGAETPDDPRPR